MEKYASYALFFVLGAIIAIASFLGGTQINIINSPNNDEDSSIQREINSSILGTYEGSFSKEYVAYGFEMISITANGSVAFTVTYCATLLDKTDSIKISPGFIFEYNYGRPNINWVDQNDFGSVGSQDKNVDSHYSKTFTVAAAGLRINFNHRSLNLGIMTLQFSIVVQGSQNTSLNVRQLFGAPSDL